MGNNERAIPFEKVVEKSLFPTCLVCVQLREDTEPVMAVKLVTIPLLKKRGRRWGKRERSKYFPMIREDICYLLFIFLYDLRFYQGNPDIVIQ